MQQRLHNLHAQVVIKARELAITSFTDGFPSFMCGYRDVHSLITTSTVQRPEVGMCHLFAGTRLYGVLDFEIGKLKLYKLQTK